MSFVLHVSYILLFSVICMDGGHNDDDDDFVYFMLAGIFHVHFNYKQNGGFKSRVISILESGIFVRDVVYFI